MELDNWNNGANDPISFFYQVSYGGYVAIARTNAGDWSGGWYRPNNNYYTTRAVEDGKWHTVVIDISSDYSQDKDVYLDGTLILSSIPIQKFSYGYFGFGSATGGAYNYHMGHVHLT